MMSNMNMEYPVLPPLHNMMLPPPVANDTAIESSSAVNIDTNNNHEPAEEEEGVGLGLSHKEKLNAQWHANYQLLVRYKEENGNCNVSRKSKTNKSLGEWVHGQRKSYRTNHLNDERIALLEAVGFVWYPSNNDWDKFFGRLMEFKEEQGHCNVPSKSKTHPHLAKWVERQRKKYQNKAHTPEQMNKLEEIGFVFDPNTFKWNAMYEKIQEYKVKYGHSDVPNKYKDDPALGRWAAKQRADHKSDTLSPERLALLREINFNFRLEGDEIMGRRKPLSKEERTVEMLKQSQATLAKVREENKKLKEEKKRMAEEIGEANEQVKKLKATIRTLAS